MHLVLSSVFRIYFALYTLLCHHELGASIGVTLSPLGTVSVCPGGQALLTCELVSGPFSFLYWDVSTPHPMATTRERIVTSQGVIQPEFKIGFTEFNITLSSDSPVISQLLISNVTTEINGSTVYCSDNRNESNAPRIAINVMHNGHFLNVSLMNQHFRNYNVTVTLQWPREAGEVYYVTVLPEISYTEPDDGYNSMLINLTIIIPYNRQYNVTIVSSLCDVNTTKVLNYITCDHPSTQLLHDSVVIATESDIPKIEGQFITYTCPPGFILTGPKASICTQNREWEPDPREVECIADCGVVVVNSNVKANYNSTLNGSVLILTCENKISNINTTEERILHVTCHNNGSWIPDPTQFTCSSFSTVTTGVILGSVLGVLLFGTVVIISAIIIIIYSIKKGFLHPVKGSNRLPDIRLENSHVEQNSVEQARPVQQDIQLVYADIGPSSVKKRAKHVVTLRPDDVDDRVEYALLNHSLQKPVIQTKQDSTADDTLNLDTLLIQIRVTVTSHWYQLGLALEVNKDVLDKCTNYPPEESIVEVLDQWLRNYPGRPTWRDVATALRQIGLQQLADDIDMVYETGKLPIQVDDDDAQQVFTKIALELPQPEEEKSGKTNFNSCQDLDESAPPLPPKLLAGSDVPKQMLAPPRPPKYVPK